MEFDKFHVEDAEGWELRNRRMLFDHPYIKIEEIDYHTPNRPDTVTWTIALRKSAVCVAPQLEDGRFLLIRQERYPVRRVLWEFPAGQIDLVERRTEQDVILNTVHRELAEETGHGLSAGGEIFPLGYYFSSQGFTDEHIYLFLARGVELLPEGRSPDADENILDCQPFTPEELRAMIRDNEIRDANTLGLFARLCAHGYVS